MNLSVYSKLALRLSTMHGFPGWSDTMSENYFADLSDVPDDIGQRMVQEVGRRFDERPSAKNLRDWARSLGPQQAFDIKQLDSPKPPQHKSQDYRQGGMAMPRRAALAVISAGADEDISSGKSRVPEGARAIIRELEARHKAEQHRGNANPSALMPTGDFGLEYQYPDGKVERFPARHSEEEARKRQAEACRKYSHFTCRVYRKGTDSKENTLA